MNQHQQELVAIVSAMSPLAKHTILKVAEAYERDPKASTIVTIDIRPHEHSEFPKLVYRGEETRQVADETEEKVASAEGFGPHATHSGTDEEETEPSMGKVLDSMTD